MVSAIATSATGLRAAALRLYASAVNVAGASSDASTVVEPVPPVPPVGSATTPQPLQAVLFSVPGGVAAELQARGGPPDLIRETVEQISALHQFKANLAVLKQADQMHRALLDVKA